MNAPKTTHVIFGIFILLAVFLFWYIGTVPVMYLEEGNLHPMIYPRVLLGGLILLLIINARTPQVSVNIHQLKLAIPPILGILFAICIFIAALPSLGFLVSSILMSFLILKILKYKNTLYCFVVSVGACTFFWYVFKALILMPLPVGTLINI